MYSLDKKALKIICNEKILFFQGLRDRLGLLVLLYKIKDVSSPVSPDEKEAKSIFDSMAHANKQTRKIEPFKKYKDLQTHINGSSEQAIDLVNMTMWESFDKMVDQCLLMIKIYSSVPSFFDQIDTSTFTKIEAMGFKVACKTHEHIGYWTAKKEESYKSIISGAQKRKDNKNKNIQKLKSFINDKGINLATIDKKERRILIRKAAQDLGPTERTIETHIKIIEAETITE